MIIKRKYEPKSEEIDLGDGGLFIPDGECEWVLIEERPAGMYRWEINGTHYSYTQMEWIQYEKRGEWFVLEGTTLSILTDKSGHPERIGWLEYQIL